GVDGSAAIINYPEVAMLGVGRIIDIYRLSIYSMAANKRVSLGNAGILFVWCFVLLATTAWLVPFTAGPVSYLLCLNSKPLLKLVETKFTEAAD
ncbi:hypothetical protein ACKLTP_17425, partial [Paenarthrobacter ureafaciens]